MIKILFLLSLSFATLAQTLPATQFKSTQNFIDKMVKKHSFDKNELHAIFATVKLTVAKKTAKKTKKPKKPPMVWDKYKALTVTNERVNNGVNFWRNNLSTLKRAEAKYHIPAEIIVAILGVETRYGRKKGTHLTLKVLTKRAFGNYRRRNFYQKELENFLLMSRENELSPLKIKGSYAGALGYPQFIPSSYRYYAVDFNQDGKIDLFTNPIDAIGSVANYFDKHHWHDYGEIARPINLSKEHAKYATRSTNKPKKNAAYWRKKGLDIDLNIDNKTKLSFVKLPQTLAPETWLTFWNFYVITRYNHDNRYAMSVYQLSQKIKQQFNSRNLH